MRSVKRNGGQPGPPGHVDHPGPAARSLKERQVERYLVDRVRALGGLCIKFVAPGDAGWPDRVVLIPKGHIGFCELKRPGEKPTPLQLHRMKQLRELGFVVDWCDSFGTVELFLNELLPLDYLDRPYPVPA